MYTHPHTHTHTHTQDGEEYAKRLQDRFKEDDEEEEGEEVVHLGDSQVCSWHLYR